MIFFLLCNLLPFHKLVGAAASSSFFLVEQHTTISGWNYFLIDFPFHSPTPRPSILTAHGRSASSFKRDASAVLFLQNKTGNRDVSCYLYTFLCVHCGRTSPTTWNCTVHPTSRFLTSKKRKTNLITFYFYALEERNVCVLKVQLILWSIIIFMSVTNWYFD
jgi:hypothetical protein